MRPSLPMLLLFAACTADEPKSPVGDDSGAGGDDSGADTSDEVPGVEAMEVTAVVSPHVVTVVTVSWTTPEPTTGWVEFGEDESYGRVSPVTTLGTTHSVQLRGLWGDTTFHFRVATETEGGGLAQTGDYTVTTGVLPTELPDFTVAGDAASLQGAYQVIPVQGTTLSVVVLDDQARVVWYHLFEEGPNLMRALITADREGFVFCLAGHGGTLEQGMIQWVSYDGAEVRDVAFPYVDHDFTELPDGTWAGIVVTESETEGGKADRIVEMQPDGTGERTVWNAWEDPALNGFHSTTSENWSHANGLDYDPVEDVYYISLKNIGTLVKVDRQTGESLWHLNGAANTFAFAEGSTMPLMQHQFQMLEDSIVIFDNGSPETGSRAAEFILDQDARTAEQIWEHKHDPAVYVFAKGDVHRFENDNTLVVWSAAGEIQNVEPDGDIVWQLNTELGYALTFVQVVEGLDGGG